MADPPRHPENEEDTGVGPDHGAPRSTRRWAFVLGIVMAIALVALMIFLHLTGTLGPGVH